jgi:hypothetical protein
LHARLVAVDADDSRDIGLEPSSLSTNSLTAGAGRTWPLRGLM